MNQDITEIIERMSLEEKAGMCSGEDAWYLKSVERLGLPSVMVSDGPHGLRKQVEGTDHLGINGSVQAVCFPASCMTACSFDKDLANLLGETLGDQCVSEDVSILLGPGVNIKRSPLCGRNFEYFSEDPYITGQLAKAYIQGVQAKGVGTAIKHFAANNQEYRRMSCSSEISEQALREIYLASFEIPIKEVKPKVVMCSYNKVNGVFASENEWLLNTVLRDEWGFEGYVMSDWGAVVNRVAALKAGLDLEMPSSGGLTDQEIVDAVHEGAIEESLVDRAVERIVKVVKNYLENKQATLWEMETGHKVARRIADESAVLLKNDHILPLKEDQNIAFIGAFAETPRYQGGGSSHVNAFRVSSALDSVSDKVKISYAKGYNLEEDVSDIQLIQEAVAIAKKSDVVVIFAGLPEAFESEGFDRSHMRLPECQNELIGILSNIHENIVVVLHNGSAIEMPWVNQVSGILEMYLGGQAVGESTVNLLFGMSNPCGRLAETFPVKLEDNPSYLNFPGDGQKVHYREDIFVGYRYYDKKKANVLFPFGHGLSYTNYEYSDLKIDKAQMRDDEILSVSVVVRNSGNQAGKEVVQLYVGNRTGASNRPVRELKGFDKINLKPGESKKVTFKLDKRSFAEFNTTLGDWYVPSGYYQIEIGKSSREILLEETVEIKSTTSYPVVIDPNTILEDIMRDKRASDIIMSMFSSIEMGLNKENKETEHSISAESAMKILSLMPLRSVCALLGLNNMEVKLLIKKLKEATQ